MIAFATSFLTFISPPTSITHHLVVTAWFSLSLIHEIYHPFPESFVVWYRTLLIAIHCITYSVVIESKIIKVALIVAVVVALDVDYPDTPGSIAQNISLFGIYTGMATIVLVCARPRLATSFVFFAYGLALALSRILPFDACAFIVIMTLNGKKLYMDVRRERWLRG